MATWNELEIARLRECLSALSESTGKQALRVQLTIEEKPSKVVLVVTAAKAETEASLAQLIIAHLARCGFSQNPEFGPQPDPSSEANEREGG